MTGIEEATYYSPFTVQVEASSSTTTLRLSGECDSHVAHQLRDVLETALATSSAVVLDVEAITFIDSSALNVLLAARQHETPYRVTRGNRVVDRVFELTGLTCMYD